MLSLPSLNSFMRTHIYLIALNICSKNLYIRGVNKLNFIAAKQNLN